jgi:hypothetical protein
MGGGGQPETLHRHHSAPCSEMVQRRPMLL